MIYALSADVFPINVAFFDKICYNILISYKERVVKMAVYLIDFENVSSAGISGVQLLTKEDKVYIFYTLNAASMSFATHLNLLSSAAEVVYYCVTNGSKNALDFQLASFLGYLISEGKHKDFYIISNDKGYDHVKDFWERNGIAEGVKIHNSPSINRSIVSIEKPFTVKIQAQQNDDTAGQTVQTNAETDKCIPEKTPAEAAASSDNAKPEENEAAAEKPVKRRGRPRKNPPEITETTAEVPEKKEELSIDPEEYLVETKGNKKTAKAVHKETAAKSLKKSIRSTLGKADIGYNEDDIMFIEKFLKSSDGKQQFYRMLTGFYGMEKGLRVYRAIRTDYANISKLI